MNRQMVLLRAERSPIAYGSVKKPGTAPTPLRSRFGNALQNMADSFLNRDCKGASTMIKCGLAPRLESEADSEVLPKAARYFRFRGNSVVRCGSESSSSCHQHSGVPLMVARQEPVL